VELQVDRRAALERAAEFVAARQVALGGFENAVTMSSDGPAAVFLQRTPEPAHEPPLSDLRIWHWRVRWFRSEEKAEVRVDVGPSGRIFLFEHVIPEAQAGTTIELSQARALAEDFLTRVIGLDLATLEEVEAASKHLDHRVDHTLEWRVRGYERPASADFAAGAGTLRHRVRVQGDEIGLYEYDYKVPEAFERQLDSTMSRGLLLTIIAFVLLIGLGIAAVVVMVRAQRSAELQFRPSLVLGFVVVLANLVTILNSWPQLKSSYPTQMPYPVYIGIALAGTLLVALIYGLVVLACAASGDYSARRFGLPAAFALGPVPRPTLLTSTVLGYAFGCMFLGYVTLFYLFGRRYLGVWMPAEGPYSEVLSTAVPALAPLAVSILAAVSEESVFRLFAVPFLGRVFRGRGGLALALIVPAVIWAFAHSNYPVFPVWVRGLELTIAGVAFGMLFLRAGFLAVVIAHYVIDAIFLAAPLILSGNRGYLTAGVVVVALAALPALAILLWNRAAPQKPTAAPA
jgi:membrane protease YdiL (CAAX protease family)